MKLKKPIYSPLGTEIIHYKIGEFVFIPSSNLILTRVTDIILYSNIR